MKSTLLVMFYIIICQFSLIGNHETYNLILPTDIISPVILCNPDLGENWSDYDFCNGLPDYRFSLIITDDQDMELEITQFPLPGSSVSGSVDVTITAIDDAGNTSSCSFLQEYYDIIAPEIICPPNMVIAINPVSLGIYVQVPLPTIVSGCDSVYWFNDLTGGTDASYVYSLEVKTVTYFISDTLGNSNSCQFLVEIVHSHLPTIILPDDPDFTLSTLPCYGGTNEPCDSGYVNSVRILNADGIALMENLNNGCVSPSGNLFPEIEGETTCHLSVGQIYSIQLEAYDMTTEHLAVWIDLNNDGDYMEFHEYLGISEPNVGPHGYIAHLDLTNFGVTPGPHKMRVRAMQRYFQPGLPTRYDACISTDFGDIEEYVIYFDYPQTELSCGTLPNFSSSILVTGDVFLTPQIIQSPEAGTVFTDSIEVTIIAIDDVGNVATRMYMYHAPDSAVPDIFCPADTLVYATELNGAYIMFDLPTVFDDCNNFIITNGENDLNTASGFYESGYHIIEYIVHDESGNVASCMFNVNVTYPAINPCFGDLNNDLIVDAGDLTLILENLGCVGICPYDLNDDGIVNVSDVQVLMGALATTCP